MNLTDQTTSVYLCRSCGDFTTDPPPPLRECSNDSCNTTFVSEERNCESCNRPFTSKLADHGCEDCLEPMEEVEVYGKCGECGQTLEPGGDADIDDDATSRGGDELVHVTCCDKWLPLDLIDKP